MDKNAEREKFEKWYRNHFPVMSSFISLERENDGQYVDGGLIIGWSAWQAALVSPAAELTDEQIYDRARIFDDSTQPMDKRRTLVLSGDEVLRFARALLARSPAQPQHENFDAWQANPYTKVLQQSIKEDYVPRCDTPAAPEQKAAQPAAVLVAVDERAAFETFAKERFFDVDSGEHGYKSWPTKMAWNVWQETRRAALPHVQPESKDALAKYEAAIKEAEAILGSEYAMQYGTFFDLVQAARASQSIAKGADNGE